MSKTPEQVKAMWMLMDAVISAVEAAGAQGAPGGILYAAMMSHGFSLQTFEMLMLLLVEKKCLVKRGQLYFVHPEQALLRLSKLHEDVRHTKE